ncbi:MAG: DUF11 domain-containing protein, partial [Planctomycetales bacterium]|nr:DUF11 domain-containing protein [Planctomycetales bacterium]
SGSARFEAVVGDNGRLKWTIYRLAGQSAAQLSLKVVARESRAFDLTVAWTCSPRVQAAQIVVQEPKLEMMLTGPRDVLFGETKTFAITVSNPGTGPAEDVVIQLLPAAGGQEAAGVSKIGTLAAGQQKVIEVELTARQAGALELRAQAFAEGGLRAEAAERINVRRAALEATIAGPPVKYAGTMAVYQVRVANIGDALGEAVRADVVLPRNSTFVSASDGGAWNADRGRIEWQIGALRPGASRVFEIRCVLGEGGGNRLEVVASGDGELAAAGQCVTQVEALADLKLQISDPPGPQPTGEPMVYEVQLTNRGTKAAERVQLAAFFSEGLDPVAVDGGPAEIGQGQIVFHPIQRIVAGQTIVFKITAKARSEGNHTFQVDVVCASPETKLAAQETTQFYMSASAAAASTARGPVEPTLEPRVEAQLPPLRFEPRR